MKITDMGNFTKIELETEDGQANYLASMKNTIAGDYRTFVRTPETAELGKFLQDNAKQSQVVVKCGEVYNKLR